MQSSESATTAHFGLKQFRSDGCLSYLIWDRVTMQAALVDPSLEAWEDYRDELGEQKLQLVWAIDTHTHADHCSATHLAHSEFGATVVMSSLTESKRPARRVADRETLPLGELTLTVLATPGHTPDSISILIRDGAHGAVFTGDTLLISATGRTDFPGADAGALWNSLQTQLATLPDETLVFPGHDYSGLAFSTIGVEMRRNPQWRMAGQTAFSTFKSDEILRTTVCGVSESVRFNLEANPETKVVKSAGTACGAPMAGLDRVNALGVDKFVAKLEHARELGAAIDVREPSEFTQGHIPRTQNIPLSELGLHLLELQRHPQIFLVCHSGRRSEIAARTLSYLGLPEPVSIRGGILAWQQAGFSTEV